MERIGRYEILAELGRGAMGVVYRARDPKIGRDVAIKTIRLSDKVDPSEVSALRERLFREAQSAGRLSHPGIVTIYDIEEQDDLAYISMEFVEGRTLEKMISVGEARDFAFVAQVMRQAGAALDYAHSRDIIHRDVKPANLMITGDERVKITDFGIARVSSSQLTQTGMVMGTPSYMSPEQVTGDPIDGRSDQFSLAVIAYEMLTGQKPFAGEHVTSVMFKIVSEMPVEPKVYNPRISPQVQATLLKALSKSAQDRYPACAAFAAALASQMELSRATSLPSGEMKAAEPEAAAQSDEAVSVGETAPAMHALKIEKVEEAAEKTRPVAAPSLPSLPSLPPLASRPRAADQAPAAKLPEIGKLPEPVSPKGRVERLPARRVWPLALVLVVLVAAAFVIVRYPELLQDPGGLLRAVTNPGALDERMHSSITLLLEKNRLPLPPVELTAPLEQAVRERRRRPAAASSEQAENQTPTAPAESAPGEEAASGEQPAAGEQPAETARKTETPAVTKPAPKAAPRTPTPKLVAVQLKTSTAGAQVVVDRNPQWSCVSPCSIELPRGRHVGVASLAGFRSYPKIFEVGDDSPAVDIQIREITGTLLVSSDPSGADVTVDGRRLPGLTNLQHDVSPGYHLIRVHKEGAGTVERSVRVQEGGLHPVHFTLRGEGERSRLVVTSNPAGADIVINDRQRAGTTPTEMDMAPGRYRIAVSRNGYRPVIQEIELTPGQPQNLEVTLSPQN